MNSQHMARYLILLQHKEAQRALLFNSEHHYLAELIDDDGSTMESLLRCGTRCSAPPDLHLDAVMPRPAPGAQPVQCYALA
jgi:hypothetical protein